MLWYPLPDVCWFAFKPPMLPKTIEELDRIRHDCHGLVTQRAGLSSGAAIVPLPGVDVIADVGLLLQLLPEINQRFGLSPEQISGYAVQTKTLIASAIIKLGTSAVGKVLTKEIIVVLLKRVGVRVAAKQVVKYIPFLGQAAAAALSFGAMKFVGDQHVNECYELAKRVIQENNTSGGGRSEPVPA